MARLAEGVANLAVRARHYVHAAARPADDDDIDHADDSAHDEHHADGTTTGPTATTPPTGTSPESTSPPSNEGGATRAPGAGNDEGRGAGEAEPESEQEAAGGVEDRRRSGSAAPAAPGAADERRGDRRALPPGEPARLRRHVDRAPRLRRAPGTPRRGQAARRAPRRGPDVRLALPARGAGRGAPRAPERRAGLRLRPRREHRPALHRDGVHRGSVLRRDPARLRLGRGRGSASRSSSRPARACTTRTATGVVHRDVKPGNLLRALEGDVKLADFGIAKATEQSSITQVGSVLGTAAYLAPEQARGEEAGPSADLYALGVVAYQLISGRLPYEAASLTELALKQQREEPPMLDTLVAAVSPELADAVAIALALDPRERYRTRPRDGPRGERRASTASRRLEPAARRCPERHGDRGDDCARRRAPPAHVGARSHGAARAHGRRPAPAAARPGTARAARRHRSSRRHVTIPLPGAATPLLGALARRCCVLAAVVARGRARDGARRPHGSCCATSATSDAEQIAESLRRAGPRKHAVDGYRARCSRRRPGAQRGRDLVEPPGDDRAAQIGHHARDEREVVQRQQPRPGQLAGARQIAEVRAREPARAGRAGTALQQRLGGLAPAALRRGPAASAPQGRGRARCRAGRGAWASRSRTCRSRARRRRSGRRPRRSPAGDAAARSCSPPSSLRGAADDLVHLRLLRSERPADRDPVAAARGDHPRGVATQVLVDATLHDPVDELSGATVLGVPAQAALQPAVGALGRALGVVAVDVERRALVEHQRDVGAAARPAPPSSPPARGSARAVDVGAKAHALLGDLEDRPAALGRRLAGPRDGRALISSATVPWPIEKT